jgi:hypothetical protein
VTAVKRLERDGFCWPRRGPGETKTTIPFLFWRTNFPPKDENDELLDEW